ncbi:MAG: hypothetical protein R2780_03205 [Crocinitomicaceae bacterium]
MPNIIKGFNCLFFIFFSSQISFGQVLTNATLNLNTNGKIYDVEYLVGIDRYVVVGDFTINDVSGNFKNIIFLNSDLSIASEQLPVEVGLGGRGTDGPIHGVGAFRYFVSGLGFFQTSIYIGGEFTTIGDSIRPGAGRLIINDDGSNITYGPIRNNTFKPDFDYPVVYDVDIWSSRAVFTGAFTYLHVNTSPTLSWQIALFYANNGNHYTTIDNYNSYSNEYAWNIGVMDGVIFLAADQDEYLKISPLGTLAQGGPQFIDNSVLMSELDDSLMVIGYNHPSDGGFGSTNIAVLRKSDLTEKTNHAYSLFNSSAGTLFSFDTYNEMLFAANNNSIKRYELDDINLGSGISPAQSFPLGSSGSLNHNDIVNPNSGFVDNMKSNLLIRNNYLFVAFPNMTSASGQARNKYAVYCLPPHEAQNFINPDTLICQGDTITYSIPAVQYADGYEWSFTGTGLDMEWPVMGEEIIDTTNTPFIEIAILENFTSGTFTVTPYSTCGGTTVGGAKVYGKSVSINLGLNPLPNVDAGIDTVLNCYNNEEVILNGYSDSVIVEYRWNQILNPFFPDSIGINYTAHDSDWYVLKVKAPNGCLNFDTVFVDMDTIKPTFNPIIPDILGCDDTIYVTGVPNNGIDTICWWNPFGTSDSLPNPLQCSDNGPYSIGNYDFYTKFIGNGCISYTSIVVEKNDTVADIQINGYASIPISGYLDVITCAIPSLNLQTYSNTTNSTVNWMDNDSTNPQGDTKLIAASGLYLIQSINNDNNCIDYAWLQIGVDSSFATLMIDQPIADLNCSNDSILLNGSTFTNDTTLIWTGTSISPSNNPLYVTSPGYYTFNVTKNSNGCTNKDSVLVVQNNSIDINTSNDTVGCNQDQIDVSASYVGNISGITYSWSNGATSASTSYTAGLDSLAIIEINGNGGCYGTDTVKISIPPLPAISVQGYAPCGTPNSGYLVVTPLSGWAPFEYSIDGGTTFQSSSTLAGLSSGNYTITIKDSLGCIYDFPATLSDDAAPPTPDFLLSTYNYESDTIAIVNVSNPMPDSVNWIFPSSFIVIDDNDTLPLVILPDTGEFVVTMEGYYGACIGSKTKVIHVTEFDTTVATLYNENGIKSVSLYPNPTNGNFTVEVELYKEQNIILNLSDMSGYVYEQVTEQNALIYSHDFQMDLNAQNGTYVIYIAAEFDSAYITFILNK